MGCKSRGLLFGVGVWLLAVLAGAAQGQGTRADYERSATLGQSWRGKVFGEQLEPQWIDQGEWFWYRRADAVDRWAFVRVRSETGEQAEAFDHAALAAALSDATGERIQADRLPIQGLAFADEFDRVMFAASGRRWSYVRSTQALTDQGEVEAPPDRRRRRGGGAPQPGRWGADSPDGRWSAWVDGHNVFVREGDGGEAIQLTEDGEAGNGYLPRFYWSPDSSKLVVIRHQPGDRREVLAVDSAPDDQLQPGVIRYHYLKPGDRVPIDRPDLFDLESRQRITVDHTPAPNPYDIRALRWRADSSAYTYEYNARGHQVYRVIEVDAQTGAARVVIDESPETFFCYSGKCFSHYRDEPGRIVWMSERSGWNHLYQYDWHTGEVEHAITSGEWVVRSVERVDDERGVVWFWAGGVQAGQDPYYLHYCRASLDGSGVTPLTASDGTHTAVSVSPNGKYLVATWSRVDHPPVHELRSAESGERIAELARADDRALRAAGWRGMEPYVAKGRDGETDIYGVIVRPSNFEPGRSYPVIEYIYAGPHSAFVPKAYTTMHWMLQPMAELGFIVVMIDGMGTSHRSKAFHDVCWQNLADSGFPDRIAWMRAAAATYPEMDLTRVGIFGGSAGGQSAMRAMLDHPEFYDAAAADCGCHDNRMDKIWWNEQWMGWPIGEHYAASSNVEHAHRLQGHLLLTVGELDRNVDPASTMQVVDALVAAGKDFDLIVFPGAGHGACESAYGRRRRADFFVRHLLGVEPRWEPTHAD
ncbi:MAG: prolyl oligopeptidase family serine peptidase [Phycisphaerales bacterium JB063]